MERVATFGSVTIEVPWTLWVALEMRGQDWLRSVASKSHGLADGGFSIEMADYRLPEFIALCERLEKKA